MNQMSVIMKLQGILNDGVICEENIDRLMYRVARFNAGRSEIKSEKKRAKKRRQRDERSPLYRTPFSDEEIKTLISGEVVYGRSLSDCVNKIQYMYRCDKIGHDEKKDVLKSLRQAYKNYID